MRAKFDAQQQSAYPLEIEERRARKRLACASLIFFRRDEFNGGLVFNISEDGMALSAAKPLFAGQLVTLQVQFPDSAEWIDLTGEMVWKNKSNKEIGVRFVGLTDEALRRIRSWIISETSIGEFPSITTATSLDSSKKALKKMRGRVFSEGSRVATPEKEVAAPPRPTHDVQERPRILPGTSLSNSVPASQTLGEEQRRSSTDIKDKSMLLNRECTDASAATEKRSPHGEGTTDSRALLREPETNVAPLTVRPAQRVSWAPPHANAPGPAADRRSDRRVRIIPVGYLQLGESNGGIAFDVSEGGVAITATVPLDSDYLPRIRLQFPDMAGWIETSGQIAWRSPSKKEAGVRFVGLKEEALRRIRDWILAQAPANRVAGQGAVVPEEQDTLVGIRRCAELPDLINASAVAFEDSSKPGEAPTSLFAPDLDLQDAGVSSTALATPAPDRPSIRKALRLRSRALHVQRWVASLRPSPRVLATLFAFICSLLITRDLIVWRGTRQNASKTSVAAKTKPPSEGVRGASTAPVSTNRGVVNLSPPEESPESNQVEQVRGQTEHASNDSPENLLGATLAKPRLSATSNLKAQGREVPNVFTEAQPRKRSSNLVAGVSNRPLKRAQQTASSGSPTPPQLEAKIPQPVSSLAVFPGNAQPAGKETSALIGKQPASPANMATAIAILTDPYPSLRVTEAGAAKKRRREMRLQLGHLLARVEPVYPEKAKQQGIQGTIKLHAIIGRDGSVRRLEALDGPPSLVAAAMKAVWEWRYSETLLAGKSVETEVDVAVVFRLSNPVAP